MMIKTKTIKENYTVCDLCGDEERKGLQYSTGVVQGKMWFCNHTCNSYYNYPTKEEYLISKHEPIEHRTLEEYEAEKTKFASTLGHNLPKS